MQRVELLTGMPEQLERLRKQFAGKELVGIYRQGGYGDKLVQCAFARAVERELVKHCPRDKFAIVLVSNTYAEHPVCSAIFAGQPIDAVLAIPAGIEWQRGCLALQDEFDLFFDVQYVVAVYARETSRFYSRTLQNQQDMRGFSSYYSEFPFSNNALGKHYAVSQFDIMSWTGGVRVTPDDLYFELPEGDSEKLEYTRQLAQIERHGYITVHCGQGGVGSLKVPEPRVFYRLVEAAERLGLTAVQIGHPGDPRIENAFDARDLTIVESAKLIRDALLHVDCEGFLAILCRALRVRCLTFLGPTPASLFHFGEEPNFPGHFGWCNLQCEPCWWHDLHWLERCRAGHRCCINLPSPSEAAYALELAVAEQRRYLVQTLKQELPRPKEVTSVCREFSVHRVNRDFSQWGEQRYILDYFGEKSVAELTQPPRFLDLGAFDGVTGSNTHALAQLGWEGVMVEASPLNFRNLLTNVAMFPRVTPVCGAIMPRAGLVKLFENGNGGQISTCFKQHHLLAKWIQHEYEIASLTAEQIVERFGDRFDFVSIDIEGMEEQVVPTLGPVLRSTRLICFEDRIPNCDFDAAYFERLMRAFAAFGFTRVLARSKPGNTKEHPSGNTLLVHE